MAAHPKVRYLQNVETDNGGLVLTWACVQVQKAPGEPEVGTSDRAVALQRKRWLERESVLATPALSFQFLRAWEESMLVEGRQMSEDNARDMMRAAGIKA